MIFSGVFQLRCRTHEADLKDVLSLHAFPATIPADGASNTRIVVKTAERANTVALKTSEGAFLEPGDTVTAQGGETVTLNVKSVHEAEVLLKSSTKIGCAYVTARALNKSLTRCVLFTPVAPDQLLFQAASIPVTATGDGSSILKVTAAALRDGHSVSDGNLVTFHLQSLAGDTVGDCVFSGLEYDVLTALGRAELNLTSAAACDAAVTATAEGDTMTISTPAALPIIFK